MELCVKVKNFHPVSSKELERERGREREDKKERGRERGISENPIV